MLLENLSLSQISGILIRLLGFSLQNERVLLPSSLLRLIFGPHRKKLGRCQADCDRDSDCASGLVCAKQHATELRSRGFDRKVANCGRVLGGLFDWVCFSPDILNCKSGKPAKTA